MPLGLPVPLALVFEAALRTKDLTRIADNAPPNSAAFKDAAAELRVIARQCRRLALRPG